MELPLLMEIVHQVEIRLEDLIVFQFAHLQELPINVIKLLNKMSILG